MTPREFLLLPNGELRRVVTVGHELLSPDAARRASAARCACGNVTSSGARSCGSSECVARLWREAGNDPA